jgi:integrase
VSASFTELLEKNNMANLYKKMTTATDPVTGKKTKTPSKRWWGRYRDALGVERRMSLAADKKIAQQKLNELVQQVEREKAGLADSIEVEMKKPITVHLEMYHQHLIAKNDSPRHIKEVMRRIKRVLDDRQIKTAMQLKTVEVEAFINDFRTECNASLQTCNHYMRSMKSFARWMMVNERLYRNPLESLTLLNTRTDRRHDRRPLAMDEFMRLYEAAKTGPPVEGISGHDRAMLYLLAAWTGYRKGELGSLTLRHFVGLDTDTPMITVRAGYSKRRRDDRMTLHPDIADHFKTWLEIRRPASDDEILFPISGASCGVERKTADMLAFDLMAARRFWIAETNDEAELKKRHASDFLKYQDADGKFADFHALRHTFITNLCYANVAPKTAQLLARHSDIKLTMQIYTHINDQEQADAIKSLPGLNVKKEE